jgi:hypothetical protein
MNRIVAGTVACEETAEVIVLCLSHFLHSQSANDAGGNVVRSHDNCQAAVKTGAKQGFL